MTMNNSTATSAEDLQLSALLASELDAIEQDMNSTETKKRKANATKVLLSEIGSLLDAVSGGKGEKASSSSKASSSKVADLVTLMKNDPKKLATLLQNLIAKSGNKKQLSKVLQALSVASGTNQVSLSDVVSLINAVKKPAAVEERFNSLMNDADKYMKMADKAMDEQGVSKEEAMNHPMVKAALGALLGNSPAPAPASDSDADNSNAMRNVKMQFAMDLSKLMSSVFAQQAEQSNEMTDLAKAMMDGAKATCDQQIKAQQDEEAAEAQANTTPWWSTLISALVIAAGAVVTLLTAGTAAPVVAAICVSVIIGVVMMSPAGTAITQALDKAIGGDNPSIGAQIGTSCIIAAITTILTLGAGGFATVAESAANDGLEAGIGAAAKGAAGAAGEAAGDAGIEMVEMGAGSVEEEVEEEAVGETFKDIGKSSAKAAKQVGKLVYSMKALTEGLGARAGGLLIQNIIGSGILIQGIQGLMELTPEGRADLQNTWVEVGLAVGGAIASFGIAYGAGAVYGIGVEERSNALEKAGLDDGIGESTKKMRLYAKAIDIAANSFQAVVGFIQFAFKIELGTAQLNLGTVEAEYSMVKFNQQTVQALQSDISSQAQARTKQLMEIQGSVLDTMGEENQNMISAIAG